MSENMYDAWDNGDRHEIRQQFARREEIIRMAREQGLPETATEGVFIVNSDDLGRMLAAEREACARACETAAELIWEYHPEQVKTVGESVCTNLAAAIRARGD